MDPLFLGEQSHKLKKVLRHLGRSISKTWRRKMSQKLAIRRLFPSHYFISQGSSDLHKEILRLWADSRCEICYRGLKNLVELLHSMVLIAPLHPLGQKDKHVSVVPRLEQLQPNHCDVWKPVLDKTEIHVAVSCNFKATLKIFVQVRFLTEKQIGLRFNVSVWFDVFWPKQRCLLLKIMDHAKNEV